jgi:hypothetical protein
VSDYKEGDRLRLHVDVTVGEIDGQLLGLRYAIWGQTSGEFMIRPGADAVTVERIAPDPSGAPDPAEVEVRPGDVWQGDHDRLWFVLAPGGAVEMATGNLFSTVTMLTDDQLTLVYRRGES